MYEIKRKPDISKNIKELLENQQDFNKYIEKNVKKTENWNIFADSKFFKENKIEEYKGIKIFYNDFLLTDNIIVLAEKNIYSLP